MLENKTFLGVLKLAISTWVIWHIVGDLGLFFPLDSCLATSLWCSVPFVLLGFYLSSFSCRWYLYSRVYRVRNLFGVWQASEVLDWFRPRLNQVLWAGMNSNLNASQNQGVGLSLWELLCPLGLHYVLF